MRVTGRQTEMEERRVPEAAETTDDDANGYAGKPGALKCSKST